MYYATHHRAFYVVVVIVVGCTPFCAFSVGCGGSSDGDGTCSC